MVCKINFDYEILLSDNNDSITSSEISSDDECFNKTFSLGDNFLDPNPLKIISVRRLNNFSQTNPNESDVDCQTGDESNCKTIPLNNYLYYDESMSCFEEESVSECEFDSCFDSGIIDKNDFKSPNLSLTYELPIVNRFQVLPDKTVREFPSIDEVNRYCINEKLKRLQAADKIQDPTQNIIPRKISQETQYDANQTCQIASKRSNEVPLDQSTLSPEILSNLPIDLLTDFINGEKSEKEVLNEISKKSFKKRKKGKKSKRHKIDSVKNNLSQKLTKTTPSTKLAINSIKSQKNLSPKNHTIITDLSYCSLSNNQQIISKEAIIAHKLSEVDNNSILSDENSLGKEIMSTQSNVNDSTSYSVKQNVLIEEPSFDSIDNSQTDFHATQTKDEKQNFDNNFLRNCSLQNFGYLKHEKILIGPNENSTGNTINNEIPISEISSIPDGSKDTRTSSTDSGFHEIEPYYSNDKDQQEKSKNEIKTNEKIDPTEFIEIVHQTATEGTTTQPNPNLHVQKPVDEPSSSQCSVSKHLDLSSFKFRFINESDLNKQNNKSIYNAVDLSSIDTHRKPDRYRNYNDSNHGKPRHNIINPSQTNLKYKSQSEIAQLSYSESHSNADNYHHTHTHNHNQQQQHQQQNYGLLDKINQSNLTTTNTHDIVIYTQYCDPISSIEKYNPFRVNYYSPDYAISNKKEISLFLYFQWLKFCEQCTIENHNL